MPRAQPGTDPSLARQILSSPYGYAYVCAQAQAYGRLPGTSPSNPATAFPIPPRVMASPTAYGSYAQQPGGLMMGNWCSTPPSDLPASTSIPAPVRGMRGNLYLAQPGVLPAYPGQITGIPGAPWMYGYIAYVSGPAAAAHCAAAPPQPPRVAPPPSSTSPAFLPPSVPLAETPTPVPGDLSPHPRPRTKPFDLRRAQRAQASADRPFHRRLAVATGNKKATQTVEEAFEKMSVDEEMGPTPKETRSNRQSTLRPADLRAGTVLASVPPRTVPPLKLASPVQFALGPQPHPQTSTTWPNLSTPRHLQPRVNAVPEGSDSEYDIPSETSVGGHKEGTEAGQADEENSLYDGQAKSPFSPELVTPHTSFEASGRHDRSEPLPKWRKSQYERTRAHDELVERFTRATSAGPVYVPAFLGATGLAPFTAHESAAPPRHPRVLRHSRNETPQPASDDTARPNEHKVHQQKSKQKRRQRHIRDIESESQHATSDSTAVPRRPKMHKARRRRSIRNQPIALVRKSLSGEKSPRPRTSGPTTTALRPSHRREHLSLTPTRHFEPLYNFQPLTPIPTTATFSVQHKRQSSLPARTTSKAPFRPASGLDSPATRPRQLSRAVDGLATAKTAHTDWTGQPMSIDTPGYALTGSFAQQQVQASSAVSSVRRPPHQPLHISPDTADQLGLPLKTEAATPLHQMLQHLEEHPHVARPNRSEARPLAPFAKATHNALFNIRLKRSRAKQLRATAPASPGNIHLCQGEPSTIMPPVPVSGMPTTIDNAFDFSLFRPVGSLAQMSIQAPPAPAPGYNAPEPGLEEPKTPGPDRKRRRERSPSSHVGSDEWYATLPSKDVDDSLRARSGVAVVGRKEFPLYRQPVVETAEERGEREEEETSLAGTEQERVERTGRWVMDNIKQRV